MESGGMTMFIDMAKLIPAGRPLPSVSFLVTSYNKAAYLPAVLASIRSEADAVAGEIILVDDGSSDGSEQICAAFAKAHPWITYWRQSNRGIYATVNSIAARARGEWVRFCDSDDPLLPGSTDRLINAAQETDAGVAYGQSIAYGPEPLTENGLPASAARASVVKVHPDGLMYLIRNMNFTPSMAVCRADALREALPLPADLVSCQDLALWFPVVSRLPLAFVGEPVCFNLKGTPNQLSANYALTLQQTIRITQRNADLLSAHHKRAALLKAANRTRRWLRKMRPDRNSLGTQLWLMLVAARARFGRIDFNTTLDKIASCYETELGPILDRRAKPF
jgi:glycosyltransferase involved in cell wall biosynthesis